jgi:hypothetical protein
VLFLLLNYPTKLCWGYTLIKDVIPFFKTLTNSKRLLGLNNCY